MLSKLLVTLFVVMNFTACAGRKNAPSAVATAAREPYSETTHLTVVKHSESRKSVTAKPVLKRATVSEDEQAETEIQSESRESIITTKSIAAGDDELN